MIRNVSELYRLQTFIDRYNYLRLDGVVGRETFGYDRYLSQVLYKSRQWRSTREQVIIRDNGCDLGDLDFPIPEHSIIIIHHMNALTLHDIETMDDKIFDIDYLVCTSLNTHNAIHFGNESLLPQLPIERRRNDTCPWI